MEVPSLFFLSNFFSDVGFVFVRNGLSGGIRTDGIDLDGSLLWDRVGGRVPVLNHGAGMMGWLDFGFLAPGTGLHGGGVSGTAG